MGIETENKIANFPAISYKFWYDLLTGKGFEDPTLIKRYPNGLPSPNMWSFKYNDICFHVSEWELKGNNAPYISILKADECLANIRAFAQEMDNIMTVIDGIVDRNQLPLCVGIPWAAPLIETLCRGD